MLERDACLRPCVDDEDRYPDRRGHLLVGVYEYRHRRRQADSVHGFELEQAAEQNGELIPGALRLGRDPAMLGQALAVVEAEHGLGVADVDREQHKLHSSRVVALQCAAGAAGGGCWTLVAS